MMQGQQIINTLPQQGQTLTRKDAYWVAGFMVAGIVGLVALAVLFRKHVEL